MRISAILLAVLAFAGCGESKDEPTADTPVAEPSAGEAQPEPREERCGSERAWEGGQVLEMPDGARVYYRVVGRLDAPAAVYLHGGPGYNAYGFERAVGAQLERSLRMVYLDQRGCGRSRGDEPDTPFGMEPTVADLERLREALSISRWSVIGHSFGGLVALEYAKRHPDAIDRLVLVEAAADPAAAIEFQIATLVEKTADARPEVAAIARRPDPPMERITAIYQLLGRVELQRHLHWADEGAQRRAEDWDREAGLLQCTREGVALAYGEEGRMGSHPELIELLAQPALFIAGRHSRVISPEMMEEHCRRWGARLVWMEESGHFPFVEEPERFAATVVQFVTGEDPEPSGADPR